MPVKIILTSCFTSITTTNAFAKEIFEIFHVNAELQLLEFQTIFKLKGGNLRLSIFHFFIDGKSAINGSIFLFIFSIISYQF